jgi:hypothetical protein
MFSLPVAPYVAAVERALADLYGYVDRVIAQRRQRSADDLLSALVAAETDGDRLKVEELRSLVIGLIVGGHDTTRCQLGQAIVMFLRHPDQWRLLADHPEHADTAVEEVLRVAPAVPAIYRIAREDFTYRDLTVPAGSSVLLATALAHTDPLVYGPDPGFDIAAHRPPQLIFGAGPHYCLGAQLARLELRAALPILARRLPGVASGGPITRRPPLGVTGPHTLPITFAGPMRPGCEAGL